MLGLFSLERGWLNDTLLTRAASLFPSRLTAARGTAVGQISEGPATDGPTRHKLHRTGGVQAGAGD